MRTRPACSTRISRSESGNGSGLSTTRSTTAKIDVFAPIASASVATAATVNAGARSSRRVAWRISWPMSVMGTGLINSSASERRDNPSRRSDLADRGKSAPEEPFAAGTRLSGGERFDRQSGRGDDVRQRDRSTPIAYVQRLRIEDAKRRLERTD